MMDYTSTCVDLGPRGPTEGAERKEFVCYKNLAELLKKLERNSELAIHWFEDNYIKLHPGKCHLLISVHKYEHQWVHIGKDMVWEENKVKHLGITIENELIFDSHILNICSKANKKN